jgi:hypothetical protein
LANSPAKSAGDFPALAKLGYVWSYRSQATAGTAMALYDMRTYTLCVGKMAEAVKLYTEIGYPALCPAGRPRSSWDISRAMLAPSTHPHLEIRGRRRSPQALGS